MSKTKLDRSAEKDEEDLSPSKRLKTEDASSSSATITNAAANASASANTETTKEQEKSKSPHDLYFEKMEVLINSQPDLIGRMVTRGLPRKKKRANEDDEEYDDDDDDSDDEEVDPSSYTAEEMESLRTILITKKRSRKLQEMKHFVLGEQADSGFMMFNTSFSYEILDSFSAMKKRRSNTKKWCDKFDLLFAYTFMIKQYDCWMQDNEGGMEGMVKGLASLWKQTLKKGDEDLGIDGEYTRPGVVAFLDSFKEMIESAYSEPPFQFKFH